MERKPMPERMHDPVVPISGGTILIVSAPSGAGKTSLVRSLMQCRPKVRHSVSFTTRAPRAGERDGVDYCFVSPESFEQRHRAGEFLESAEVHGNFYATSRRWIDDCLARGGDVIMEIDWQGARQVRAIYPDAVSIFVMPPSLEALRERLLGRGKDSKDVIERRVAAARSEIEHAGEFQYVIINQELSEASRQLVCIADSARLRTGCQMLRQPRVFSGFGLQAVPTTVDTTTDLRAPAAIP